MRLKHLLCAASHRICGNTEIVKAGRTGGLFVVPAQGDQIGDHEINKIVTASNFLVVQKFQIMQISIIIEKMEIIIVQKQPVLKR